MELKSLMSLLNDLWQLLLLSLQKLDVCIKFIVDLKSVVLVEMMREEKNIINFFLFGIFHRTAGASGQTVEEL